MHMLALCGRQAKGHPFHRFPRMYMLALCGRQAAGWMEWDKGIRFIAFRECTCLILCGRQAKGHPFHRFPPPKRTSTTSPAPDAPPPDARPERAGAAADSGPDQPGEHGKHYIYTGWSVPACLHGCSTDARRGADAPRRPCWSGCRPCGASSTWARWCGPPCDPCMHIPWPLVASHILSYTHSSCDRRRTIASGATAARTSPASTSAGCGLPPWTPRRQRLSRYSLRSGWGVRIVVVVVVFNGPFIAGAC